MRRWYGKWFGRGRSVADRESLLAAEREAGTLRIELEELRKKIAALESDLERERKTSSARLAAETEAHVERLLSGLATPVTQLLTQARMIEVEDKALDARSVLALAKLVVHALEESGMGFVGQVGGVAPYDPACHSPLSADAVLKTGEAVVIRFAGVSYRGKVLRRAGVEPRPG